MYKLLGVRGKDFLSFKEFYLDLSKPGLWLISGYNEVGGDSNGSGKSSIYSAISWGLTGRTSKGVQSDIARWGTTAPQVELFYLGLPF